MTTIALNRSSDDSLISLRRSGSNARITTGTPVDPNHPPVDRPQGNQSGTRRPWRSYLVLLAILGAIGTAGVELLPWRSNVSHSAKAATERVSPNLRNVTIDRPAPAAASQVVLPATVQPWQKTTLHARVSGYLGSWQYDLGELVRAGDLLAKIDTPELDQELAEGKALTREASAAIVQAKAERIEAEADLRVAEAQLNRVRAETALAKSQLVRRVKLLASHTISQEEYDTYLRQVEARNADVAAAESAVARHRANLQTRSSIIAAREATANSRQASVDRLQELQTFKRIVAPFDGVVIRRTAEVGMLVTAGKESLFVLEDRQRVRVQINVPQSHSALTRPGASATVAIPESSTPATSGTITRIAGSVDQSSRTMLAEMELDNQRNQFQPGSFVQVTISTQPNATSWTIPTNTLAMRVQGPHVALVNDRNQIELRRLTLGRDLGTRVVVLEGIGGTERLVVNPTDDLTSGIHVQVTSREVAKTVAQH